MVDELSEVHHQYAVLRVGVCGVGSNETLRYHPGRGKRPAPTTRRVVPGEVSYQELLADLVVFCWKRQLAVLLRGFKRGTDFLESFFKACYKHVKTCLK